MYECGKLKKIIGNKFLFPVILEQCEACYDKIAYITLFENDSITDINYPELFSLFHIDTWWGQSKYVRKFDISQANFEKTQNLFILKFFLWILCINMQNCSISKELRHKSFENLQTISKLAQEPLNYTWLSRNRFRWTNLSEKVLYMKSCVFSKISTWHWSYVEHCGANWPKMDFRAFI